MERTGMRSTAALGMTWSVMPVDQGLCIKGFLLLVLS